MDKVREGEAPLPGNDKEIVTLGYEGKREEGGRRKKEEEKRRKGKKKQKNEELTEEEKEYGDHGDIN